MDECETIRHLKAIVSQRGNVATAAARAIDIIDDIRQHGITGPDARFLHDLVDTIYAEGHFPLLDHLRQGILDCDVCAALALRVAQLRNGGD